MGICQWGTNCNLFCNGSVEINHWGADCDLLYNGSVEYWNQLEPRVSDTSANSQQAGHLLDIYSCSLLFTDVSHIQLHIEIAPKDYINFLCYISYTII